MAGPNEEQLRYTHALLGVDPNTYDKAAAAPTAAASGSAGGATVSPDSAGDAAGAPDAVGEAAGAPVAAGAGGTTWTAPFGLGSANETAGTCVLLVDLRTKLHAWDDVGYTAEIGLVTGAIDKQMPDYYGNRALTAQDVQKLTALGLLAQAADQKAVADLSAAIAAQLDKFSSIQTQAAVDKAAELLHQTFKNGDGDNKIADAKALLDKAGKLAGTVKDYAGYAAKAKTVFKAAAKLEDLEKSFGALKTKFADAGKMVDLASDVATLAGKVNTKFSGTAGDIAKFKAGIAMIDFVMSKTKVPVIGTMWTDYIKPATEIAMDRLQKLDDMIDKSTRDLVSDEWWQAATKGAAAPAVTASGLAGANLAKVFPGGQAMLDFMWALYRGPRPDFVPASVSKDFLKFRKQFNAGLPKEQQLETDAAWYNLWDLGQEEVAKNLMAWVMANRDYIWAAQYGALSHP